MPNKLFITHRISWTGIDAQGNLQKSKSTGSLRQLRAELIKKDIVLTAAKHEFYFHKKESQEKFLRSFTADLASILNADMHLIDALTLLKHRYQSEHITQLITLILQRLHAGHAFSSALLEHPQFFNTTYIQLIKAAESIHQLPLILSQLAKQQEFAASLKYKLKKALIYPMCVLLFTVLITVGLITFAIPQFKNIFSSFNATLPATTQWILTLSQLLQQYKYPLIFSSVFCFLLLYGLYKKSERFYIIFQILYLTMPWMGKLYRHKMIAHWSYIMSLSLKSKLPLPDCLHLANQSLSHILIKKSCDTLVERIKSGRRLHEALSEISLFDSSQLDFIRMGESSHTLEIVLERLSIQAFTLIEQSLENLSKWLEPVMMLILALIAGGLIISMYLPIFKIGAIL